MVNFTKNISGLKYIKSEVLPTILPLSEVVGKDNVGIIQNIETPLFFNVKDEKFVFFLCDEFLSDVKLQELIGGSSFDLSHRYKTDEGVSLYPFSFKSLKDLRATFTDIASDFNRFTAIYDAHLSDIKTGQEVIIVLFKNSDSIKGFKSLSYKSDSFYDSVIGTRSTFEYMKAIKFNNKYYLVNAHGSILQESKFNKSRLDDCGANNLVIPFTPEDWDIVANIHTKMTEITNKIKDMFGNQYKQGILDAPLSESSHPFLEDMGVTVKKIKP